MNDYNALHARLDDPVRASARIVVPFLLDLLPIRSVIDIGCGTGHWLAAFQEQGISEILGLDGSYIDRATLQIPGTAFREADLTQPWRLDREYDLAICLEVAEHLPEVSAEQFLDSLTRSARVVFFSAAIPGQGGVGHVNEQWPSHWQRKFSARGYVAFDLIRRWLWPRKDVLYWYAQNSLLYVREFELPQFSKLTGQPREFVADVIHPQRYLMLDRAARAAEELSLGEWLSAFPRAAGRFARRLLGNPAPGREPVKLPE